MGRRNGEVTAPDAILQFKGYDVAAGWIVGAVAQREPSTPSEWFGRMFPKVQARCGTAFLESVSIRADGRKLVTSVDMNLDFMAGVVGGDPVLKHKCVFVTGEQTWYFLEPRNGLFTPTTDEKMKLLLSQYLRRCAEAMPASVDIGPLFGTFRSDETLRAIVKKAKAMHAADETVFSPDSPHKRAQGPEVHTRITKQFVREAIKPMPGELLPIDQCFAAFAEYCKAKQLSTIARKQFKQIVAEVIKEEFDVGFRHDLETEEHKYQRGWRGLSLSVPSMVSLGRN